MTWTGASATTLPLSESYHREGNGAQTLVGGYVKSAKVWCVGSHQLEACDAAECQSFMNDLRTYSDDDFYVNHTCYATNIHLYTDSPYSPLPKQCSCVLTMTNFSDQGYNKHSMDSKLLCLHWQLLVRWLVLGLMPRIGAPETGKWVSGHCCT